MEVNFLILVNPCVLLGFFLSYCQKRINDSVDSLLDLNSGNKSSFSCEFSNLEFLSKKFCESNLLIQCILVNCWLFSSVKFSRNELKNQNKTIKCINDKLQEINEMIILDK